MAHHLASRRQARAVMLCGEGSSRLLGQFEGMCGSLALISTAIWMCAHGRPQVLVGGCGVLHRVWARRTCLSGAASEEVRERDWHAMLQSCRPYGFSGSSMTWHHTLDKCRLAWGCQGRGLGS